MGGIENRKFLRVDQKVVVTYEPNAHSHNSVVGELPAWLNNISIRGASLETDRSFKVGAPLVVQIPFIHENEMNDTLFLDSEVRWVRPTPEGSAYCVGVEFTQVPRQYERVLEDFIEANGFNEQPSHR